MTGFDVRLEADGLISVHEDRPGFLFGHTYGHFTPERALELSEKLAAAVQALTDLDDDEADSDEDDEQEELRRYLRQAVPPDVPLSTLCQSTSPWDGE